MIPHSLQNKEYFWSYNEKYYIFSFFFSLFSTVLIAKISKWWKLIHRFLHVPSSYATLCSVKLNKEPEKFTRLASALQCVLKPLVVNEEVNNIRVFFWERPSCPNLPYGGLVSDRAECGGDSSDRTVRIKDGLTFCGPTGVSAFGFSHRHSVKVNMLAMKFCKSYRFLTYYCKTGYMYGGL